MVERQTVNLLAVGSSPSLVANLNIRDTLAEWSMALDC